MSRRVLIACTDSEWVTSAAVALAREGAQVATVSNGLDCLTLARRWQPHWIVMGGNLPWGTAVGVLAVLHEECDQPPVTVLLASDPNQVCAELRPEWNCRVIPDPIPAGDLCHLIRDLEDPATDGWAMLAPRA